MLSFVFAALVVLLDQFLKRWIILTLAVEEEMALIPGVIGLTHVENKGAAFSILSDYRWLLVGIAFAAALLLIAILLRYKDGFLGTLGLAAVLGGTVGNLADRLLHGYVVDMFELHFMNFAIFNVADIFITLGGIVFLISFIISTIKPEKDKKLPVADASAGYVQTGYAPVEYPEVEDEIGLYDFQFGEKKDARDVDYNGYGEAGGYSGASPADVSEEQVRIYQPYDPYPEQETRGAGSFDDISSTLSALNELESELMDTGILDDYNVEDLLREYGFEDDAN